MLFIDVDFILNLLILDFNAYLICYLYVIYMLLCMVVLFNEFDDVSAAVFDELIIMCHNDD